MMASPTVRRGFKLEYGSWKMVCTCRRNDISDAPASCSTSWPARWMRPEDGRTNPAMQRPNVLFPEPDSPTSASVLPGATDRLTPRTACTTRDGLPSRLRPTT
ncbi:hypothetical protein D3C72_2013580 [compost metagenome]